jgi:uncharacterized repeat protein (TIGR03943 family)
VRRDAQSVLLIMVGAAVLRISTSDIYLRYVKEGLRPFLLAAGAALLVLGVVSAVRDGLLRAGGAAADEEGHDHGHSHGGGPAVAWLLCLPVFAIFLVAPPALGSYAAGRDAGSVARPTESEFPPLPPGDPVSMPLQEFSIRGVWDQGRTLTGRRVQLIGFASPGRAGTWYLTRMTLNCCAADASAIKVEVRGRAAPKPDTWVRVTGRWVDEGEPPGDGVIPVIQADELQQIPPPRDPYA